MLNDLLQLDQSLFLWIQDSLRSGCLDACLPLMRDKYVWIPLYIVLAIYFFMRFPRRRWWLMLCFIGSVALADLSSSKVIKPWVERPRPCHHVSGQSDFTALVKCGGGYSFPSSHAANHFAMAIFLMLALRREFGWGWNTWWIVWAASIAFAQVYVGVHYPLDVVAGALLGSMIGLLMARLYTYVSRKNRLMSKANTQI